jgi:hypothetical protein
MVIVFRGSDVCLMAELDPYNLLAEHPSLNDGVFFLPCLTSPALVQVSKCSSFYLV